MMDHESKCPRRPITCTHCETFSAPVADMEDHWKECKSYPIQCENKCGEKIKRDKMAKHLKEHCPLTVINCEYCYAGCDVTLPRKEMAAYMDQAAKDHLQLVTTKLTKQEEQLVSLQAKLDLVQKELTQKDVDTRQEIAHKDDQLTFKDKTIDLLKQLCDFRDDGESKNQVLVSNFDFIEDEHVIKSVFGQFGRIEHIDFFPWSSIAVVKFAVTSSVDRLFERHDTTGIKLRKVKLDCIRLAL